MQFNEHHLELSIMELFENQGYAHITGSEIHHEKTEVLLIDVLRNFLLFRYGSQNITENEITSAINRIKKSSIIESSRWFSSNFIFTPIKGQEDCFNNRLTF